MSDERYASMSSPKFSSRRVGARPPGVSNGSELITRGSRYCISPQAMVATASRRRRWSLLHLAAGDGGPTRLRYVAAGVVLVAVVPVAAGAAAAVAAAASIRVPCPRK
jgi:hypothetical protein